MVNTTLPPSELPSEEVLTFVRGFVEEERGMTFVTSFFFLFEESHERGERKYWNGERFNIIMGNSPIRLNTISYYLAIH